MSLEVKEIGADKQYIPVEVENQVITSIHRASSSGQPIYLKANKPLNRVTVANEFGYLDHTKNVSIFSLEMLEMKAWNKIDFEALKPFNEDVYIDLKSSPPTIFFRPIWFNGNEGSRYQIRYYVAVSKDPEALDYYTGCDYSMMSRVLKKGYTPEDAVQVFSLPLNPQIKMELGAMKPYLEIPVPLSSGHKYFASVYAQVSIKKPEDDRQVSTSESLRVAYARIEFEYRSFFYPVELLAATIGLIGLMVASCCVFNSKLSSILKKKLKFKQVAEGDVDSDLEEYFMRIKSDYDQLSAGHRSHDVSQIVDNSIDVSTNEIQTRETLETKPEAVAVEEIAPQEPEKMQDKSVELV